VDKKLIYLVAGARPNFMKIAPIVRELNARKADFDYRIVHTGQHYDQGMSGVFFEDLQIPEPDYHLEVGGGSHAEQTAKVMTRFEAVCLKQMPDIVLVVGDVNSTLACAIVAKKLKLQLVHVEAGLRSGDRSMPEEINRLATDAITDHFFVTEPSGAEHLAREGQADDAVHFVGHVMIDNLYHQVDRIQRGEVATPTTDAIKAELPGYGVVTLHRPANVDDRESLATLVDILAATAERIPLVFPIHPRTRQNLERFGLNLDPRIRQLDPLPYIEFLNTFKDAQFVMTDSGGLQEETTALGVPCITLRDSTERPVTVDEGTNTLAPLDLNTVTGLVDTILAGNGKSGRTPRFWDGQAAKRILDVLQTVPKTTH